MPLRNDPGDKRGEQAKERSFFPDRNLPCNHLEKIPACRKAAKLNSRYLIRKKHVVRGQESFIKVFSGTQSVQYGKYYVESFH